MDISPVCRAFIVLGLVICKRYSQNNYMNALLRKICTSIVLSFTLVSLLGACASGGRKSYCDFVVENEQPTQAAPAQDGPEDAKEAAKPKKKLRN